MVRAVASRSGAAGRPGGAARNRRVAALAAAAFAGIVAPVSTADREPPAMRAAEAARRTPAAGRDGAVTVSTRASGPARGVGSSTTGACEAAVAALAPVDPAEAEAADRAGLEAARRRVFTSMSAAADEPTRAALLFLTASGVHPATHVAQRGPPVPPCEGEACAPVPPPGDPGPAYDRRRVVAAVDDLARMAIGTADGRIYALADRACLRLRNADGGFGAPVCHGLSAGRWAQIDTSNAMAWLEVASEAAARHDDGTVGEAMHRLTAASRSDTGMNLLLTAVTGHMAGQDAQAIGDSALAIEAIGVMAAVAVPSYLTFGTYCNPAAVVDANRRQTCSAVADALTRQPGNLLELSLGIAIGGRSGWPAERVEALRAESKAIFAAIADSGATPDEKKDASGCAGSRRMLRYARDWAAHGEVGAARLALERSRRASGTATASVTEPASAASR